MKNILFITFNDISDCSFGGGVFTKRNYNMIKEFGNVTIYRISKKSNVKSCLSFIQGFYPPILFQDKKNIIRIVKNENINIVFFDSSLFGKLAIAVHKLNIPSIVYYSNCERDYTHVRFGSKWTLKKIIYYIYAYYSEYLITKYTEIRIALSARDKNRIETVYGTEIHKIMPITIEDKYTQKNVDKKPQNLCLLFSNIGRANVEGVTWFVKNVAPHLNGTTIVAGKGWEKYKEEFEKLSSKVLVYGYIENPDELYMMAAVVAIPLFSGAGMKIKTAEALMFGKYIFGTAEAFEGYEIDEKKIGGICQSATDYIGKINKFYITHSDNYNSYARNLYLEKYCIEASKKSFGEIFL